jgi:hypothetical protein
MLRLFTRSRDCNEPYALEGNGSYVYPRVSPKGLIDTHFRTEAYLISEQRKVEVEAEKAMAVSLSRHERWKGTGWPY